MGPLIKRQYGSRAHLLTTKLKRNLAWRFNEIGTLPPRILPLALLSPMGAHSDAQGHGRIATKVLFPKEVTISTRLPKRFIEMVFASDGESPIYLFEMAAAILTACVVSTRSDGNPRTCVLCVDNKAALAALIKGSSASELGAILINLFWSVAARCPVVWRFEYVNTKSNAADPPSRERDAPMGLTCAKIIGEVPSNFSRISSSRSALRRESTLLSN